jgi:hypothetical protein
VAFKQDVSPLGQAQEQVSARTVCETGDSEPTGRSLAVLILGTTLDTDSVPHHLAAGGCGSELGLVGETADELHAGQRVDGRGREGASAIEGARKGTSGEHVDVDECGKEVQLKLSSS